MGHVYSRQGHSHQGSWGYVAPSSSELTTVMLRNLPNDYTRSMLLQLLDVEGFSGAYDFVYLPIDFKTGSGLGYAFLNFTAQDIADQFRGHFNGFSNWTMPSRKVANVDWSRPNQGLQVHIERYRNSTVMHEIVPDDYKPAVFHVGVRVPFPSPTKAIKEPQWPALHSQCNFQRW